MAHELLHDIYEAADLGRVLSHRLFGGTPKLFDDHAAWIEWRCALADGLGVDDHSVLVVGSAAFGISLNPHNEFRAFAPTSDIDVAVVSQRYFDIAWFELREMRDKQWLAMPKPVRTNSVVSRRTMSSRARLPQARSWHVSAAARSG